MRQPAPRERRPFTGRSDELRQLDEVVRSAVRGRSRLVALAGEPGIGKTRLLSEAASAATGAGCTVRWGRAAEFERRLPFGVFADALDDYVSGIAPERLAAIGPGELALLTHVFPSLRRGGAGGYAVALIGVERHKLHRAVRVLLEAATPPGGLLVVLDDLHWADDGSIELCEHLLRHPPRGPLVVAMAFRPRQIAARLTAALDQAAAQGHAEAIELGPLTFDQAECLFGEELSRSARRGMYEASGGNPFYLEALVRHGGADHHPVGDARQVPHLALAALTGELAALDPGLQPVAHAAAVVGDVFDAELVADVAQLDVAAVLAAVDELIRRDVVRSGRQPGCFEFRHPLVHQAAYEAAGPGWRVSAHGRAAEALSRRSAPIAARAHHVERSGRPGDRAAVDVLTEAAVGAMNTAPASAVHWLRAALRLLPQLEELALTRLGLLLLLARALGVTGRLAESRDVLHEVVRLLPPEPAERRAQAVGFTAMVEQLLGRHAESRALLETELRSVTGRDAAAAVILKIRLSAAGLLGGDFTADRRWAKEALADARVVGDQALLAAALGLCAAATPLTEAEGATRISEAAECVDALVDGDLARHLEAAVWLGWAEMYAGLLTDGVRHLERALRLARETGQTHLVTYVLMGLGSTYVLLGRLAEASDCFDDALEVALLTGSDELRTMALAQQAWVTVWRGDVAEAVRCGEAAVASADQIQGWYSGIARAMLAQARLYRGEADGAIEALIEASGGPGLPAIKLLARPGIYSLLAQGEVARGRLEAAQGWADRALMEAATFDSGIRSVFAAFAHLAQAYAALLVDPVAAARWGRSAAAAFGEAGDVVDAGRAHLLVARACAVTGDVASSAAEFARARELFEGCGANLFLDQLVREQRRLDIRAPRSRQGPGELPSLTARELDVAQLVVTGLTNKQIAEQLFVSHRTVETHLAHLFAKLDVSTRAAVAPALSRLERPERPGGQTP